MPKLCNKKPFVPKKRKNALQILAEMATKQRALYAQHTRELRCAAHLLMLSINNGSKVDVYSGGCFWEARVEAIEDDGFFFTYEGSDDEFGFVRFKEFMEHWRMPYDTTQVHLTSLNLELLAN
jgi:hypothetical protein